MSAPLVWILTAVAACLACLATTPVQAQATAAWRLHTTIEGDGRPFLCKDRESVGLVVAVEGRAMQARDQNDGERSKRLIEIASRLQGELCSRPAADDIVILRCKLEQQDFSGAHLATVKVSAVIRADASKGEQPFFAWTFARIEESAGDADSQKASSRWCGTAESDDEPLEPVADLVLRVQNRLYDFGLRIPQANGQMTPETLEALSDFQKFAGLPATGRLTRRTLQKIDETPAPSPWISVAFDGYGNYGTERGQTRRGAESDAITKLQQRSHADYKVSSVPSASAAAAW